MNYKQMLEQFERLNESLRRLNERIEALERQQHIGPPSWPIPGVQPQPFPTQPTPWDARTCPTCGLKLEGVMGYVCTQPKCPTGLGGAWS